MEPREAGSSQYGSRIPWRAYPRTMVGQSPDRASGAARLLAGRKKHRIGRSAFSLCRAKTRALRSRPRSSVRSYRLLALRPSSNLGEQPRPELGPMGESTSRALTPAHEDANSMAVDALFPTADSQVFYGKSGMDADAVLGLDCWSSPVRRRAGSHGPWGFVVFFSFSLTNGEGWPCLAVGHRSNGRRLSRPMVCP